MTNGRTDARTDARTDGHRAFYNLPSRAYRPAGDKKLKNGSGGHLVYQNGFKNTPKQDILRRNTFLKILEIYM